MSLRTARRLALFPLLAGCVLGQERSSVPGSAPARIDLPGDLPVREVSVFKDGHAFVLREAPLRADAEGRVVLDDLPEPVLGTFWPYASGGCELVSATAARVRVESERTALDLRQLIAANEGQEVVLVDVGGERVEGRLLGLPRRDGEEVERLDPEGGSPRLPEIGSVVRIATATSTRVIPLDRVRDLEVKGELVPRYREAALRERLTLRVRGAAREARVGLAYVQRGLRWIPAYRVDIDGEGKAAMRLEATLVNDLIDLQDVTVHLVIGAPRFEFAGQVDPIALQQVAVQIGAQLGSQYSFPNLSNALMTQAVNFVPQPGTPAEEPRIEGAEAEEDLFLFTVRGVTLKKGERLVLPVSAFELPYKDVHLLSVPFGPPPELRQQLQGERVSQLERLLAQPKVMHALRLENTSDAPLTTAPALVLARGKLLAQGLMTYTPSGSRTDLEINPAIDVRAEISERETERKPDAMTWAGDSYARTDSAGSIELTNRKREAIEVEVRRSVLGLVDQVGQEGAMLQEGLAELWRSQELPEWWSWYSWPYWWQRWNGVGRFTWTVKLEPGESTTLEAQWHYFWR